jgi:hypothetical protein
MNAINLIIVSCCLFYISYYFGKLVGFREGIDECAKIIKEKLKKLDKKD